MDIQPWAERANMEKLLNDSYKRAHLLADCVGRVKSQDFVADCVMEHVIDRFMQRALEWRFRS